MSLHIISHINFKIDKSLSKKLTTAFELICIEEKLSKHSVNLKILNDSEIKDLNRKFRNKDKPTNAVSYTHLRAHET